MLKSKVGVLKAVRQLTSIQRYSKLAASSPRKKFDIRCGVCLERKPIISRNPTELEVKVTKCFQIMEDECSLKSEHELRIEADKRLAELTKHGKTSKEDLDIAVGESGTEFEDKGKKELEAFNFAPRTAKADMEKNVKSLEREFDRHLVFLTLQQIGETQLWILPESDVKEGESLRQAADRILKETFGRKLKSKFYGNAPSGYYKYIYPKPVKEHLGFDGQIVFFMKAQYLGGETIQSGAYLDYCWATRSQLEEKLKDRYYKSINDILIDEEH